MANNVVHGDEASVTTSVPSLQNYKELISGTQHVNVDIKGKATVYAILEPALPDADGSIRWEPPPTGWIKANVDASWDAQTERGGVGVVIRDQTGSVLRSVRSFIPTCASTEAAEIIACLQGLRHLVDFTRWPVILESDAAQVIDTLSAGCNDRSANCSSYMEARGLMAGLPEVMLSKVNRQGNKVANCLAQLGKCELCGVLDDSAPPCVLAMIIEDYNNIMS
jgi:ribonuclease HI